MRPWGRWVWTGAVALELFFGPGSCGGKDICGCVPDKPETDDFRHAEKHVAIPATNPIETTVSAILAWATAEKIPDNTPRSGRELHVYHIANAYVQFVGLNPGDCDIHAEISQIPDKKAPRMIVETPVDSEYCTARRSLQSQLAAHNVPITAGQEVNPALPAEVVGLAFQDFEHTRGTPLVATTWEIHPAIVGLH